MAMTSVSGRREESPREQWGELLRARPPDRMEVGPAWGRSRPHETRQSPPPCHPGADAPASPLAARSDHSSIWVAAEPDARAEAPPGFLEADVLGRGLQDLDSRLRTLFCVPVTCCWVGNHPRRPSLKTAPFIFLFHA